MNPSALSMCMNIVLSIKWSAQRSLIVNGMCTVLFLYPYLKSLRFLRSSTPPKAEAFEDFKVGQGSKINRILKENKAVLLERRSLLRQLTEEVNAVKREIDCTAATIQQHKELREDQGTANVCIIKKSGRCFDL